MATCMNAVLFEEKNNYNFASTPDSTHHFNLTQQRKASTTLGTSYVSKSNVAATSVKYVINLPDPITESYPQG